MEAKEKAIDLKVKFLEMIPNDIIQDNEVAAELARVNAMICVDEMILTLSLSPARVDNVKQTTSYWKEVKSELEKMK
ncbi:hypothetical protein CMU75_09000 [Elizabethkingia anophelis]|nr:hypothetical protein [Elizabethkingia anophelis]MDV3653254.1 hypothetical protein [Elizabethkingia anophelis]